MAEVDDLVVKIGADVAELTKAFKGIEKNTERTADKINSEFKKTKKGTDSAAAGLIKMAKAAGLVAIAFKVAQKLMQSFNGAQGLVKTAKQLQITTNEFAKLDNLAASVGASTDDLADTIKDLNERITDAATNGGEYDEVLKSIGLSSQELVRQSPTDQLDSFITALNKANDVGKENFVVNTLAGDAGFRLAGAFKEMEGSVKGAAEELAKIIEPISDIESAAVSKVSKDFAVLDKQFERISQKLAIGFSASLAVATTGLNDLFVTFIELVPQIETFAKAGAVAFIGMDILIKTATTSLNAIKAAFLGAAAAGLALGKAILDAAGQSSDALDQAANDMKISALDAAIAAGEGAMSIVDAIAATQITLAEKTKMFMEGITIVGKGELDKQLENNILHQTLLTAEQRKQMQARRALGKGSFTQQVEDAGTFFKSISVLMNSENRKQFEIGKAAAIGGAIVDTFKAATGSYAALAGIPIVGPALGAAAAAAATVAGLANVNAIKSQSFGGGSAGPPAIPATTGSVSGPAGSEAPAQNLTQANITLIGDSFDQSSVRGLINQIQEQTDDNVEFTIN